MGYVPCIAHFDGDRGSGDVDAGAAPSGPRVSDTLRITFSIPVLHRAPTGAGGEALRSSAPAGRPVHPATPQDRPRDRQRPAGEDRDGRLPPLTRIEVKLYGQVVRTIQREMELGVSEAKVVVVVPEENRAYRERVTSPWFATTFPNRAVSDIVHGTLVDPDGTYATVSQSILAGAVREHCAEAAASWSAYHRARYGW